MTVVGKSIQLDHEALTYPESVDLMAKELDVCVGWQKLVLAAEDRKAFLQVRASPAWLSRFLDQAPNRAQRPPTTAARADVFEHPHLQQSQSVSLFERSRQPLVVDHFG